MDKKHIFKYKKELPSDNTCRICLQHAENGIFLFSGDEVSKAILDKIYSCFRMIITHKDYLPYLICSTCSEELDRADKFRMKCLTSEERCKNLYEAASRVAEDKNDTSENNLVVYDDETEGTEIEQLQKDSKIEVCKKTGFMCKICHKTLKSLASLAKHNISMHLNRKSIGKISGTGTNKQYHCSVCAYSTPYGQTLVNHMRRHDGERPHLCQCGKSFTQLSSLAAHQKTHSNVMMYICAKCGKQFKHSFSLKNHLRVHGAGKYSCNVCFKTLKSPQSLQEHINRHYNVRNYNCEDCGATFVTSSELISHKTKHKEARVECNLCGYRTYAKKNLIIHMKRHTGEKKFECDLCSKTEYTKSDLRRHQRVHTQEKPYPCPVCTQRFSHSTSLNHHVRKVHGISYRWGESKAIRVKKEYHDKKIV